MDLAVTLIKSVMRAFYTTRDILVIDALILHETLRDDDLAYLMAINTKDLHKICGKLREDRFLSVHTRQELREGNPRPSNRTWYYINYRHTIDAIKWRVYTIDKEMQGNSIPANEKKEYFCTFCKAEWTAMEVLDNVGPSGFLCHRCHRILTFEADRNSGGHEQSTRLNDQLQFISELLPKIDSIHIPECDFDRALSQARSVVRDATHQRAATIPVDSGLSRPMAVKGLANTGPQSIAVNISASAGPSEAEKEFEKARKEKIAQQNALPSWMSKSTITGDSHSRATGTDMAVGQKEKVGDITIEQQVDSNTSAQIDDIFEKLKAEQAAQKVQNGIGNAGSDDEDDENEFENVPATGEKMSLSTSGTTNVRQTVGVASLERSDDSDPKAPKRVKIEYKSPGERYDEEVGKDDDEELEFEDI